MEIFPDWKFKYIIFSEVPTIFNAVEDYQIVHLPLNFRELILYSYFFKFLPKTQNLMVAPDLPITENSINHILMVARAYPPCPFSLLSFSLKFLILVPIICGMLSSSPGQVNAMGDLVTDLVSH